MNAPACENTHTHLGCIAPINRKENITKMKKSIYLLLPVLFFLLSSAIMFQTIGASATSGADNAVQDADSTEAQETTAPTESIPPENTQSPAQTLYPSQTPQPVQTLQPTPTTVKLKKVTHLRLKRYSTTTVRITWDKTKKAKYYRIYRSRKKNSGYHCIGNTNKNYFMAGKLKNKTTYYFYVQACAKKKKTATDSKPSRKIYVKTKTYSRKTVFAGDSIAKDVIYALPYMHIGGRKKIIADRGLKTSTFYTQRVFDGQNGLQKIISEKPYRVYFMLGMNGVHYTPLKNMIADYEYMIRQIQKSSPGTDIVLCAISPVSRAKKAYQPGFWKTPYFNKKLKKLAKRTNTHYFDYTGFLKDSEGYLKAKYAASDGYHWNRSAYAKFAKKVEKFEKSLDK